MSKLKKCLYLINLMERKGAMTLKEINDYYQYSSLCEGDEFLPRTFLRYREYIEETFPCYIDFNQRTGKYELHRHQALYGEDDSLYDYLLSFSLSYRGYDGTGPEASRQDYADRSTDWSRERADNP